MPGKVTKVTIPDEMDRQITFVGGKLGLTKQQFIRMALQEKLDQYDLFKMAGGRFAPIPNQDHPRTDDRTSNEREVGGYSI